MQSANLSGPLTVSGPYRAYSSLRLSRNLIKPRTPTQPSSGKNPGGDLANTRSKKEHGKSAELSSTKNEYKALSNHPVLKRGRTLYAHIFWFLQSRADKEQEFRYQRLYYGSGNETKRKFPCNVRDKSGVDAVEMLALRLRKTAWRRIKDAKL